MKFLGVTAVDVRGYDISRHFEEAAGFIERALKDDGGMIWWDVSVRRCSKFDVG